MGSADIDELLKAATLLAEQDYVALLGSDTGKLVAAVGSRASKKASRQEISSRQLPRLSAAEAAGSLSLHRAEGLM